MKLSSWGRLSYHRYHTVHLHDRRQLADVIRRHTPGVCFGMGRSYGDMCLNTEGNVWITNTLNRFIEFSSDTGELRCESGVLLRDIQQLAVPRGWMLPVTPGTQWVTVGGSIANDVHGKNHHVFGTFGDTVSSFVLQRTDGSVLRCAPDENESMFRATIGGMGLTGVITEATLQLRAVSSPWLETESITYQSLAEFFGLARASESDWEYTVSWVDCLSGANTRGIFMRARHSDSEPPDARIAGRLSLSMPFTPPVSLVNGVSLKLFNRLYYQRNARRTGTGISHYQPFFYPLDAISNWNRMYGPQGFYQYQCVIPDAVSAEAIQSMLDIIAASGQGSFLAVLKTFAERPSAGLLSFPAAGATLALDFPARGQQTLDLFARLDQIVREAGGRLYPAKDARMSAEMFRRGYRSLDQFLSHRDPGIVSDLSRRLLGD